MRQTSKSVSPMSNEGRNAYVISHITDALIKLLEEKTLNNVSISEICEAAQVGRASFYRNFETKEDVLKAYVHTLFSAWEEACTNNSEQSVSTLLRALFQHFESNKAFYSLLNERQLIYLLKDVILDLCGPKLEDPKEYAYATAYVAYTLYGWVEVWFQRGMQETAEEIEKMFKKQGL